MLKIQNYQKLLQKQLTRKEFLRVTSLMILSIVGVSRMLEDIDSSVSSADSKKDKKQLDYGEYNYGG